MTRDELVADLVDSAGSAPWPDGVRSVVEAVLDRLEALGWRHVVEPAARLVDGRPVVDWPDGQPAMQWAYVSRPLLDELASARDYRADWEQASRDALHWREAAEKATEEVAHLRRELTARGLGRVAEAGRP